MLVGGIRPHFYRLPRNTDTLTLHREEWHMPHTVEFGGSKLVPLRAGEKMAWKMGVS